MRHTVTLLDKKGKGFYSYEILQLAQSSMGIELRGVAALRQGEDWQEAGTKEQHSVQGGFHLVPWACKTDHHDPKLESVSWKIIFFHLS